MPEQFDEITRAIQEAKAAVDNAYRETPTKPDLVSTYGLTESQIDELRTELDEGLSRLGREVLDLDKVYFQHLHEALRARQGQQPTVQDPQWRESLLTDLRDRIEHGPADMLTKEMATRGPKQLVEAVLDCLGPVRPGPPPRECLIAMERADAAIAYLVGNLRDQRLSDTIQEFVESRRACQAAVR
jgi:hypothetical protein